MRVLLVSLSGLLLVSSAGCASHSRPSPLTDQIRQDFKAADQDGDEALTPAEFANLPLKGAKFEDLDTDQNGKVTLAELKSYLVWLRVQAEGRRRANESTRRSRPY